MDVWEMLFCEDRAVFFAEEESNDDGNILSRTLGGLAKDFVKVPFIVSRRRKRRRRGSGVSGDGVRREVGDGGTLVILIGGE